MSAEAVLPRRRWDPIVKLTHWSVALAVLANAVITEEGSGVHVWVGYALAAILALRLAWGLIGPSEARFSAFPPSPGRALAHLRDIAAGRHTEHRSHNPLGSLMVYAIWICLAVIIATGIALAGLPGNGGTGEHRGAGIASQAAIAGSEDRDWDERHGDREGGDGEEKEAALGEIHEAAVNLLYALILLHRAGVAFESRRSGSRLVAAMLPGQR
jgi:cytochrome b